MKTLACVVLLASGTAFAQSATIHPPLPRVNDYYNTVCTYTVLPFTAGTGFTPDGNYVTGLGRGSVTCAVPHEYSQYRTYYYCLHMVWDLAGNLVSVATCNYLTTPAPDAGLQFRLPSGYEEYTHSDYTYGYLSGARIGRQVSGTVFPA